MFCHQCYFHCTSLADRQVERGRDWSQVQRPADPILYADDMVIFAEEEEMLRRALTERSEWCAE